MLFFKKKFFFILTLVISLIPLVSANLQLNPSNINAETLVNSPIQINLTITNNFNTTFYNLKFTSNDYISMPTISQLNAGQQVSVEATILLSQPFSGTANIKVEGTFLTPVDLDPIAREVIIQSNQYNPSPIFIHQGSTIKWINNDGISHTVTAVDNSFDYNIPAGQQSPNVVFNEVKIVDYYDENFIGTMTGIIHITNKTQMQQTHNPDYDSILTLNLNTNFENTDISFELLESTSFNVSVGNYGEGLLKITNTGSAEAFNITLSSNNEWISFAENNFNLGINNQNFVVYSIIPNPSNSTETNKTYSIDLTADGINTPAITKTISLFVPYKEILASQVQDVSGLKKLVEDLLKKVSELESQGEQVIIREADVNLTIAQDKFERFLEENTLRKDETLRLIDIITPLANYVNNDLKSEIENLSNSNANLQKELKSTRNLVNAGSIVVGLFVLGGLGFWIGKDIYQSHKKKKERMERSKI